MSHHLVHMQFRHVIITQETFSASSKLPHCVYASINELATCNFGPNIPLIKNAPACRLLGMEVTSRPSE